MDKPGATDPVEVLALKRGGSSSLEFGLCEVRPAQPTCLFSGEAQRSGRSRSEFRAVGPPGQVGCSETASLPRREAVVTRIAGRLVDMHAPTPWPSGTGSCTAGPAEPDLARQEPGGEGLPQKLAAP